MPGSPLVTGATGFAGSHLVDHLLEEEGQVAAWAHVRDREPRLAADSRIVWDSIDLLDRQAVARAIANVQPSVIYHCAGIAHVGESWSKPLLALRVNVLGTHHVLEGVRDAGLRCPVLVTGSALVYRPSTDLLREDAPIGPSDPYGVSKLAQEMLAGRQRQGPVFIVRPFNHVGPRQSPTYVTSSFARQIAEIETGLREPVLRVGNLGAQRDITDVRDTVRAYQLVVTRGSPGRPYNVCSGQAYRVSDLLDWLIARSRIPIRVEVDPDRLRPSDNPIIAGDRSRITLETGWEPTIPIQQTLGDLLEYWRAQTARQS
ncbi:MAG: GDP-mannose 4,6-dehydratase [Vicinamibacterales bacterium]